MMIKDLVRLDRADTARAIWVVADKVISVRPCPEHPSSRSLVTLAGGHRLTAIGTVEQIETSLRDAALGAEDGDEPLLSAPARL